MSYKNFLGRFGHRWFTDYDRKMVLIDFSADEYDVEVTFTDDKPDTPLKDCTGTETNVDAIMIYYKDGTLTMAEELTRSVRVAVSKEKIKILRDCKDILEEIDGHDNGLGFIPGDDEGETVP